MTQSQATVFVVDDDQAVTTSLALLLSAYIITSRLSDLDAAVARRDELQAAAAVGQSELVQSYEAAFKQRLLTACTA